MYQFYLSTIHYKGSIQYLTHEFFKEIFKTLKEKILYIEAYQNHKPIAASLYLFNKDCLYGRYWGCLKEVKNLHFELCYYRGIEFCIDNDIKKFEAGAQGEHKIKRGFKPTTITSLHRVKHPDFSKAIENYINQEAQMIDNSIDYLKEQLPFKD